MRFKEPHHQEFTFASEKVLKTLELAKQRGAEFMGTATSDFQSQPHFYDEKGKRKIFSDWELETAKMVSKRPSKIIGQHDPSQFPRFFEKKELYINRSAALGQNMFRLSLDFGRLCPGPGKFDEVLMGEYVSILAFIRDSGQEPMVTLYHWPTPIHLLKIDEEEKVLAGAWEHKEIIHHFHFYIKKIIGFLSDSDKVNAALKKAGFNQEKRDQFLAEGLVRYFLSINEPINLLLPTYILGLFPPFKRGRFDLLSKVLKRIVEAHDIAITEIKNSALPSKRGGLKIGAAHNWVFFEGFFGKILHSVVNSRLARKFEQEEKYTDFTGLNYYFRTNLSLFNQRGKVYGDNPYFGDIHPPGIFRVLKDMNTEYPNKEIFITEFGFSDKTDIRRPFWILETLRHVIVAMEHNIPVKGMLLWTLVDNFEWNLGLEQKFGLFKESELGEPLTASSEGDIRGWEAWQAASRAVIQPSVINLQLLQDCYERAKKQFHHHYASH